MVGEFCLFSEKYIFSQKADLSVLDIFTINPHIYLLFLAVSLKLPMSLYLKYLTFLTCFSVCLPEIGGLMQIYLIPPQVFFVI